MKHILSLAKPLSLATERLLGDINKLCAEQNLNFFIAGATAREILLHNVYGRSLGRRTRDIDIAIFVEQWDVFERLKANLLARGAEADKKNIHRLKWQNNELDIIPFGDIAENNKIFWPPDRKIIMAVEGFKEALDHRVTVRLASGEKIPVCSLPGLALLKLFAWRDRGHSGAKDATDLFKIINDYGAIELSRIYEEPIDGGLFGWDTVRMGAALLGYDVALTGDADSIKALRKLDKEQLTDAVLRQIDSAQYEYIAQIMEDFWHGFSLS